MGDEEKTSKESLMRRKRRSPEHAPSGTQGHGLMLLIDMEE
jgi:hypothetical protein